MHVVEDMNHIEIASRNGYITIQSCIYMHLNKVDSGNEIFKQIVFVFERLYLYVIFVFEKKYDSVFVFDQVYLNP